VVLSLAQSAEPADRPACDSSDAIAFRSAQYSNTCVVRDTVGNMRLADRSRCCVWSRCELRDINQITTAANVIDYFYRFYSRRRGYQLHVL